VKVLIIEDELNAARKLQQMLKEADPSIEIVGVTDSVKSTLEWLSTNTAPDMAFVDIQLADDTSFEIFRQYKVEFPVIFVTAYDEYIMQSFEHNSVDYLLKPYSEERLKKALEKVKLLKKHFVTQHIYQMIEGKTPNTKTRYLAKKGLEYVPVDIDNIAYFFTEHKISFIKDNKGNLYMLDKPLSDIEGEIDVSKFFRLNRKFIANISAIKGFKSSGTGRLIITLNPNIEEEVVVSRETAPAFRKWVG
jgi:DNA-binding LytR/AlgR family response regulator